MTDISWNTPYVHGVEQEVDETSQETPYDAVFTVYIGEHKYDFAPDKFLQACWTVGFDTSCLICQEAFDLATDSPVRLLGLGQYLKTADPLTKRLPSLSVTNYHLRCLKKNHVKYFPVSHPWHPSIAEAYALRSFNAKAAQTCYEVPIRTLLAVTHRFGSDYLLWHDYISIPQWQEEFRGTAILSRIFKIFEASDCAILHLGRQPPAEVVRTPTFETMNKHNDDLKRFFNAHLFSRLWPIIEFDRAGEAYIMDSEYEIMESKFLVLVKEFLSAVDVGATTMSLDQLSPLQWMYDLPLFVQERQQDRCLGYVYDMIANQGCRSFRDKFIGAAELLQIFDYPTELPVDSSDACLWLTEQQIKSNDISPLLLKPSIESVYEKACWLKGHESIERNMWDWGVQTHAAVGLPRLQDHSVHLKLNLVGTITHEISWGLQANKPRAFVSDDLSSLIISTSGATTEFVRLLNSTDQIEAFYPQHLSTSSKFPVLQFDVSTSKVLDTILGRLLQQYVLCIKRKESTQLSTLYDSIVSLLALSASKPLPALASFANLDFPRLHHQLCDPSEPTLTSVTCSSCHKQSLFRVNTWQRPTTEARLYLIPGLAYQYTVPNGTGIIVEGDRIIGRARFCTSACDCNCAVDIKLS